MKKILLILLLLTIGCGSYTTVSYRPKIKSILAVTEAGDTISVPYKDFIRDKHDIYTRFNYNNNWYGNSWRYNNNWGWNQQWLYPNSGWNNSIFNTYPARRRDGTPVQPKIKVNPKPRPKPRPNTPPITRPRVEQPRTRMSIPRGSNQTRTRTIPNTQTRTNSGRSSSGGNRGSNIGKRNN
jgi:hypothetical protein